MCGDGVKLSEITYILKVRRVQIDMEPQLRVFRKNISKLATFLTYSSEIVKPFLIDHSRQSGFSITKIVDSKKCLASLKM